MTTSPTLSLVPVDAVARRAPLTERSDEDLMAVGGTGSQAAFAILVERYMRRLVSYCAKVTADRQAAPELAQETFLQVWARRESYRPERPFRVFLFTAATNRCRNHNRWWRRRYRSAATDATAAERDVASLADPDQLDALLDQERRRRVHEALGALSPRLREVVLLRFEQGLDYGAIATIIGRPEATIRTRIFNGLKKLREHLAEDR